MVDGVQAFGNLYKGENKFQTMMNDGDSALLIFNRTYINNSCIHNVHIFIQQIFQALKSIRVSCQILTLATTKSSSLLLQLLTNSRGGIPVALCSHPRYVRRCRPRDLFPAICPVKASSSSCSFLNIWPKKRINPGATYHYYPSRWIKFQDHSYTVHNFHSLGSIPWQAAYHGITGKCT